MTIWLQRLLTFAIAGLGVAVFSVLGLPLPWLLGPMFACLIAALAGMTLKGAGPISAAMRTVLGLAVGFSITPALFVRLDTMVVTIAMVPLFVAIIGLIGYPYFRRVCGFDPATSYYSAMPGGLQDMIVFGIEAGGDARALSLIHATRVLVIVSVLPFLLTFYFGAAMDNPPGEPAIDIPMSELALMVVIAAVGWAGASAIGMFGASILGPLILATAASLLGLIHHRPPVEAILAAQFFIGLGVGIKYVGITAKELRVDIAAALGYAVMLAILAAIFTAVVVVLELAPFTEALLAFSPGGQAEMAVLAIVAGADAAFVVAHHLVRLIVVILGGPTVRRFITRE